MRHFNRTAIALLSLAALPVLAQSPSTMDPSTGARPGHDPGVGISLPQSNRASNISPANTQSTIAPTLPDPAVGDHADPMEFLRAARAALAAGRTGEAQQSLEMAETRALDRAVPLGQTIIPSASPLVARIRDARMALGNGDRNQAMQLIDRALTN